MRIHDDRLGSPAEEFHVASRNQGGFKHFLTAHQMHYSSTIQELVNHAPLRLEGARVPLPVLRTKPDLSLEQAIARRTSGRGFTGAALDSEQLATLLYLGNAVRAVTHDGDQVHYQRQVPNSGNLGSVEVFPILLNVRGIEPGIYHFDSVAHDLVQLRGGDFSTWLAQQVFYQAEFAAASVALVLTAAVGRLAAKYGPRAYRLALLDVGHVSQNIHLVATAIGLNVCATAGFIDDELDGALGLDGIDVATMLTVLVGPT